MYILQKTVIECPWNLLAVTRFRYIEVFSYRKSSIKPPPPGNLFISNLFEGEGLNRDGGFNIFNLEATMASVLHKELEYKVEKLKYSKF